MRLKENYIALTTIVRKEINRFMRIWPQTLLPSVITTVLYYIIFGSFIGSQLREINGFSYMQFIVPGLIMMSVITNSYSNVVSSFFGSKFQKSVEELLVSPTSNITIIIGYCCGGVARGMLIAIVVTIASLLFVPLHIHNLGFVAVFVFLTSFLFSLMGLANAIFARKFDDISIIPTFVLTPLTYLGGVFYSIELLSPFWQGVSKLNPVLYMVNGFRYGFLGFSDVNIYFGLGMVIFFIIVLFSANLYFLEKGIGLKN